MDYFKKLMSGEDEDFEERFENFLASKRIDKQKFSKYMLKVLDIWEKAQMSKYVITEGMEEEEAIKKILFDLETIMFDFLILGLAYKTLEFGEVFEEDKDYPHYLIVIPEKFLHSSQFFQLNNTSLKLHDKFMRDSIIGNDAVSTQCYYDFTCTPNHACPTQFFHLLTISKEFFREITNDTCQGLIIPYKIDNIADTPSQMQFVTPDKVTGFTFLKYEKIFSVRYKFTSLSLVNYGNCTVDVLDQAIHKILIEMGVDLDQYKE